jgi:hypothetical protein
VFGEHQSGKGIFIGNSKGNKCQLLELEGKEGYSECRT